MKKQIKCPKCCSEKFHSYRYGYLAPLNDKEMEEFDKKHIAGGCCVGDNEPAFNCDNCGTDFGFKCGKHLESSSG